MIKPQPVRSLFARSNSIIYRMTQRSSSAILPVVVIEREESQNMIKQQVILIVDDQQRARQSLKALLATCPSVRAIREAINGRQALQMVEEFQPDVVLMDVRMPEMNGLQATRLIKTRWPYVKVIVLSMYAEYESAALAAGADQFINKATAPDELLKSLSSPATSA